ncbi:glycosyltransferase family 2 protein, partial [Candidatus Poribacteria bacterium]|nr:glycosyltransferase family 2 protein [Candidatus Poribacteria bacterium]
MSTKTHNTPHLSIVIPAYNEAESLPVLLEQIELTLKTYAYDAEVIFINDGSTDNTPEVLDALAASVALFPIKVIHFKRNQGKAEALTAGFAAATGDIVITMDADLQDDPGEIPKLLDALHNGGYDVISGWKFPRKDPFEKRAFSFIFNNVTAWCTGVKLHDMNCGFKAYRTEVVKELHLYGDLHRYIPILVHQAGYRIGEVKVKHHPRRFGVSKYGLKRIPKGFFDLLTVLFITKYLKRPLHVFGMMGAIVTFIGVLIGIYLAFVWFIEGGVGFRPLLMMSVLMVILGVQFFSIGLLGEL